MSRRWILLALAAGLATFGSAQQKGQVAPDIARPNAEKLASQITWHDSLESVLAGARKENKLGFFMHMLGKIDGDT